MLLSGPGARRPAGDRRTSALARSLCCAHSPCAIGKIVRQRKGARRAPVHLDTEFLGARDRCRHSCRSPRRAHDTRGNARAQLRPDRGPCRSGHLHYVARGGAGARGGPRTGRKRAARAAALRHSGRGQGQHRHRGHGDHGGLSGLQLSGEYRCGLGGPAASGWRDRHRQDQSRSVCDWTGGRALPLRDAAQPVRSEAHPGWVELWLRGGSRGRACAAGARHRYGRLRTAPCCSAGPDSATPNRR